MSRFSEIIFRSFHLVATDGQVAAEQNRQLADDVDSNHDSFIQAAELFEHIYTNPNDHQNAIAALNAAGLENPTPVHSESTAAVRRILGEGMESMSQMERATKIFSALIRDIPGRNFFVVNGQRYQRLADRDGNLGVRFSGNPNEPLRTATNSPLPPELLASVEDRVLVCIEGAFLLANLLTAAGIEARVVCTGSLLRTPEGSVSHAYVTATIGGVRYYMDPLNVQFGTGEADVNFQETNVTIHYSANERGLNEREAIAQHYYGEGQAQVRAGNVSDAIESFEIATEFNPNHAEAWMMKAMLHEERGELSVARRCFDRALEIAPSNPDILFNRGQFSVRRGDREEALIYFHRAVQADPNHVYALHNIGGVLFELGRVDEAAERMRRVRDLNPDDPVIWFGMGQFYVTTRNYADAFICFTRVTSLEPGNAAAWFNLGALNRLGGDNESALEAYEEALRLDPDDEDARNAIREIRQALPQEESAPATRNISGCDCDAANPSSPSETRGILRLLSF